MKNNFLCICFGVALGALLSGFIFFRYYIPEVPSVFFTEYQETREEGFTYIKPLLECDAYGMAPKLEELRSEITDTISSSRFDDEVSLYFRDLNTGMWIGINEEKKIAPASLSKVLNLMAVYRKSEQDPEFLDEEFLYGNQFLSYRNLDTNAYDDEFLENGKKYTVRDLTERMILYSDNESSFTLQYLLNKKYPQFLSTLENGVNVDINGTISLKDYSNMFRMLYNASYLNRRNSEAALALLARADFKEGLLAGIPKDVRVASKFGFFDPLPNSNEVYLFNQCAIVYHPDRPFLLCASIPSETVEEFRESMKYAGTLGKVVYNWVDNNANDLTKE